ncbi:hypothetical protein RDV64_20695 [Acuticoccus sp. MNP-M23]|uniref:hypothetical protein n=1 Tax=Acuticoccus sp. MNP-M23 TaxID=3072793 RepID=UPI002814D91F|nr:hypothetical protein [Acuticoccus sp. MNP-M23]WMS42454.1 hypothetical protein RDV64_20695 [Acuticoccus sp. MNP-M23]
MCPHTFAAAAGCLALPAHAGAADAKALIAKHAELTTYTAPSKAYDTKACTARRNICAIALIDRQGGIPPEFLASQIIGARNPSVKVTTGHN